VKKKLGSAKKIYIERPPRREIYRMKEQKKLIISNMTAPPAQSLWPPYGPNSNNTSKSLF
jgi:hypothetical protein